MMSHASLFAVVGQPMFGNAWLALAACLVPVAVLIALVIGAGRWLAATHPDPVVLRPQGVSVVAPTAPQRDVAAVISASVVVALGQRAKVVAVTPAPVAPPSVEVLMQQWSLEGRRQIYSSHQVR